MVTSDFYLEIRGDTQFPCIVLLARALLQGRYLQFTYLARFAFDKEGTVKV